MAMLRTIVDQYVNLLCGTLIAVMTKRAYNRIKG